MSYKEKSIWISILVMVFIWADYAFSVIDLHNSALLNMEAINSLLVDAVVFTIVLEIVLHIVVAVIAHKDANTPADERDKLISLTSIKHAYNLLFAGVVLAIIYLTIPSLSTYFFPEIALPYEYLVMHLIILFAFAAELVRLLTQVFYYRRGF